METDVEEPTFFMRKEREITRLDLFCVYFNNNSKFKEFYSNVRKTNDTHLFQNIQHVLINKHS